jgi:sRNA-binding protein
MSSISITRQHIQNTTNWPLYREHRAYLADLFPAIRYSGQPKQPLCCHIKADRIGANTGLCADDIRNFLRAYTFGPKYLRALKAGAWRYDLWCEPVGIVTDDEAEFAALALDVHYEMRRAGRVGMGAVRGLAVKEAA